MAGLTFLKATGRREWVRGPPLSVIDHTGALMASETRPNQDRKWIVDQKGCTDALRMLFLFMLFSPYPQHVLSACL